MILSSKSEGLCITLKVNFTNLATDALIIFGILEMVIFQMMIIQYTFMIQQFIQLKLVANDIKIVLHLIKRSYLCQKRR